MKKCVLLTFVWLAWTGWVDHEVHGSPLRLQIDLKPAEVASELAEAPAPPVAPAPGEASQLAPTAALAVDGTKGTNGYRMKVSPGSDPFVGCLNLNCWGCCGELN